MFPSRKLERKARKFILRLIRDISIDLCNHRSRISNTRQHKKKGRVQKVNRTMAKISNPMTS